MLTEPVKTWGQVGSYLSLLWVLRDRGVHWVRAAVGVSFRWVSLLPPSLLQPRVSPMGCDGIRYSVKPKKRSGVLLGKDLAPELVQCCSQVQEKQIQKTTKKQKLWQKKKLIFSTAGGANCLFNFYFSASSEKQKSPSMCFLAEVVKVKERGWKSKWKKREKSSVPSSSCPDAGLRSTFPICALSLSRVESRREAEKEQDREGERVSNSGVRLNQSVRQAGSKAAKQCILS